MKNGAFAFLFVISLVFVSSIGSAATYVKILPTKADLHGYGLSPQDDVKAQQIVGHYFNPQRFREVRAQVMRNQNGQPDHIIVYLLRPGYHQVRTAVIYVDSNFNVRTTRLDYRIQKSDVLQEVRHDALAVKCPDPSIQFIAFAPNDDDIEQQVTTQVSQAAISHGLKTVTLLKAQATSQNYLDYMSCPNVVGNFYDGDANPTLITTADGTISSDEIANLLKGAFRLKVANIWLACQAFNNPMLASVVDVAQSQKYFAGINNLQVGPSDRAAACTMVAAIGGQNITDSFNSCYKQYDNTADNWGNGGHGSEYLGK